MNYMIHIWILPILSALFLVATLPWADQGWLAWVALVPLLFFLNNSSICLRTKLITSGIVGWIYGCVVLLPLVSLNAWWWVGNGFFYEYRTVFLACFLVFVAFYSSGLFFVIFSWVFSKTHNFFVLGALWTTLELLRIPLVYNFTWGALGYSQYRYTFLIQIVDHIGVIGLSGVIVAVNVLVFHVLQKKTRSQSYILIIVVIFTGLFAYSAFVKNTSTTTHNQISVGVAHVEQRTEDLYDTTIQEEFLTTIESSLQEDLDILVLPENIFPFLVMGENNVPLQYEENGFIYSFFEELTAISRAYPKTEMYVGIHRKKEGGRFNSVFLLQNGTLKSVYDKNLLLPGAEHAFGFWEDDHIAPLSTTQKDTSLQHVSIHLCSEIGQLQRSPQEPISITPANDSVFDSSLAGKQHHIINVMRSIQHNQHTLHASKGGVTSIISPQGEVLVSHTKNTKVIHTNISF